MSETILGGSGSSRFVDKAVDEEESNLIGGFEICCGCDASSDDDD
jgi:hypothetical protein